MHCTPALTLTAEMAQPQLSLLSSSRTHPLVALGPLNAQLVAVCAPVNDAFNIEHMSCHQSCAVACTMEGLTTGWEGGLLHACTYTRGIARSDRLAQSLYAPAVATLSGGVRKTTTPLKMATRPAWRAAPPSSPRIQGSHLSRYLAARRPLPIQKYKYK